METEFESAPEESGGMKERWARAQAGHNVLFLCLFLLFLFSGGLGRRGSGCPIRIGNASLGRDKDIPVKARRCHGPSGRM